MKIWIVVADQCNALFYDTGERRSRDPTCALGADDCRLVLEISHPRARATREPESDRLLGRAFSSGTGQRYRSDDERSSRCGDHERFAGRIGEEIERARRAGKFDRLVLSASPSMLALIRSKLLAPSRALLAAEVAHSFARPYGEGPLKHLIPDTSLRPGFGVGGH